MTITTILKNTKNYPLLFNWTGGIPHKELEDWLLKEGYTIPSDLETLWNKLGGVIYLSPKLFYIPGWVVYIGMIPIVLINTTMQ
jgi:hypothetical protein